MNKPRIAIADDHKIVVEGLRTLLDPHFLLVGTANDGRQLLELVEQTNPAAVVADISMPLLNGIEATRKLRQSHPHVKSIILTMHPDVVYATRALEAGASAYVLKHSAPDELVEAIHTALSGGTYVSPALRNPALDEFLNPTRRSLKSTLEFTGRQKEVLQLLTEGKSAKEIGAILDISPRTVETHKYKMMDDLGVKTTAQLVQHALKHGLV